MVLEPRCVKCGRPKLSTISLLCWRGYKLGYWDTHYEPVSEEVNDLLIKASASTEARKFFTHKNEGAAFGDP